MKIKKDKASKNDDTASMSIGEDLLVVLDGPTECGNMWMLDSVCSHYYTSHREWFATYQKTDGGSVSHGDDHPCKVAGVGTVRVRMYGGVI